MIKVKVLHSSFPQQEFEFLSQKIEMETNKLSNSHFSSLLSNDESYLKRKRRAYSSILNNYKRRQGLCRIIGGSLIKGAEFEDSKTYLLNEVISLLNQAIKSKKYFLTAQIALFESTLYGELDSWEKYLIDDYLFLGVSVNENSYGQILESYSDINRNLKFLKNTLLLLLKRRVLKAAFDIRDSFRNIIQFLFKNMDDENDSYTSLNKYSLKVSNNYQINLHYVKKRNYFSLTDYHR